MRKVLLLLSLIFITQLSAQNDAVLAKVEVLGYKIDSTLANNDTSFINEIYSLESFSDRFMMKSQDKEIKDFNKGFSQGFNKSFNFGNILVKEINSGSSYDFIRAFEDEKGNYHLLFRLYGDGLNYHEHLVKKINNEFKIIDTYVYLTGEYLSGTIKTLYESVLFNQNLKKFQSRDSYKDILMLKEMKDFNSKEEYQKTYDLFNKLSKKSQEQKFFKIIRLMAASNLAEEVYEKAIEDYEKHFPNDPSLYLISVDGYILKKQYDKSILSLDKLDETIGGDSFLNYLKGNVHYLNKDYANAQKMFDIVIEEFPYFIDVYDSLLSIYIETNKNEKAIDILNLFLSDFELTKNDLETSIKEFYPEFLKTNEFKEWFKKE